MHINLVDLNLFLVFQAIYQTRSVTLAGKRLSMTQSAVSNALKRTREQFGDPLFVRTPEGMIPTALAERLIGPTLAGLSQFSRAIDNGSAFDPATSERHFRLAINDVGQLAMMPALLEATRSRAPGISFETVDASFPEGKQRMSSGQIDLALGSWDTMGPGFCEQTLFGESFVVLMCARHRLAGTRLGFDDYMAAEHIAYSPSGANYAALQHTLARAGVSDQRKIVLTAAHSLGLSSMVASSNLLLTAPSRLAKAMTVARDDLLIQPLPFEVIPFFIRQQWHERFQGDSGNRWLRELVFGLFHQATKKGQGRIANRDMDVPA
jgi:DNA-binding transcriptional LysR family regulator